jgi:ATP-dependent helicase YprA (DUF1998 family)
MANAYINIAQELSPSDLLYINTKKQLQADIVTVPDTFIFTGASISNPSSLLPQTTIANFEFYVNGQNVPSSLASFNSYNGGISVTFITGSLGYSLETDDEIIAIGKFA